MSVAPNHLPSHLVTYSLRNSIATITMDDGKVNVMSLRMLSELNTALDKAITDRAVVVLTGRPGVFSAGFDLPVLRAGGPDARAMIMAGFKLAERLLSFPTPVVVACNGHALAMGVFLVLAADYRVGAAGEFKLGANEVAIGLTLPHVAIEILRQRLTPAYFNRAAITAEIFSPEQAVAAGFLDQVVAVEELHSTARLVADRLAALHMPSHAATKLRVREHNLRAIHNAIETDSAILAAR
ncbi:MAG TPA: crotonase/enoyl-CoA hydratase family protein [Steroidobacteraceae bacterium]|nr:crotonase/enoyl-CoA hydratase family protein [Steroidobacteraceae bacterium]